MNLLKFGVILAFLGKFNSDEESCILEVMVHQTLLLNCLDYIGMEYVLPYSFVKPFVSVGYFPSRQVKH